MASTLLSSITGGGDSNMIMPVMTLKASRVEIKDDTLGKVSSTSSTFYTALQLDHTDVLYDVATLQTVSNTLEQEITDTGTGNNGILTQVLTSKITVIGDVTIRVYIDDKPAVEFTHRLSVANDYVMCVGDFTTWPVNIEGSGAGILSSNGYGSSAGNVSGMLTPLDTLASGLKTGMVFEDRLRVTIQGEFALTTGSTSHKAAAAWLTYIPEGVK